MPLEGGEGSMKPRTQSFTTLATKLSRRAALLVLTITFAILLVGCGDTSPTSNSTTAAVATTSAASSTTTTAANSTTTSAAAGGATTAAGATGGADSSLGAIPKGPAQLSGPVIIALNTEITGAGSQTGGLAKQAADIAVEKINSTGGINGQQVQLKVEDAQSSNQGALAALNKAADDKAIAMVGPVKSTQIQAISQRIQELKMPSLIGGTNVGLTKAGNPWLFRFRPDDSIAGGAMANYAVNDLKGTKIAIIHDSDAFGTGGADVIESALKGLGKSVVSRQKYTTNTQDFTAQILAIKSAGADVVCLYSTNAKDGAVILRQIKEQGLKLAIIGSPSYGQTVISGLSPDLTEGVYVVQDFFTGRTPEYQEYAKAWQAKYNTQPDGLSAWNWDAIILLSHIVAQVGTDNTKIHDAILQTKGFKGAVGTLNFTPQGNGLDSVDIAQYKAGNLTFIKNVKASS